MSSKSELRASGKSLRNAIAIEARRDKSIAACHRSLSYLANMKCVAVYSAIRSELCPNTLVTALRACGTLVAYPRVSLSNEVLEFAIIRDDSELAPGCMGIAEPPAHLDPLPLSAINAFLVPALRFDRQGHRLGWGRGYYDQTLAQCPDATRVGICFQEQIVASLPSSAHDRVMDMVVTDSEHYLVAGRLSRTPPRETS